MKSLIKKSIPKDSRVYKFLKSVYEYRYWHPHEWKSDMLQDYASFKGRVNFIQVGSSNGISADPINKLIVKNDWHGILVEPVPYIFEELKNNYSNVEGRLIFENSAVATSNGKMPFYRLQKSNDPGLPFWYEQLGSFNKEVVWKHRDAIPGFDNLFIEDSVNSITFKDLLAKHHFKKVDFIQIDAEGYDYEILKMIPFSELNVEFVMFENRHLSSSDYHKAIRLLKDHNFALGTMYKDTIGISKDILPFILSTANMEEANISKHKQTIKINSVKGKLQEPDLERIKSS